MMAQEPTDRELFSQIRRDLENHARILSEHNNSIAELKTGMSMLNSESDVRDVRDEYQRAEIKGIKQFGWLILSATVAGVITTVISILTRGAPIG